MVFIFVNNGESGVSAVEHDRQKFFNRLVDVDGNHLSAWDHDVPYPHFVDANNAFDHFSGLGVDQLALFGFGDDLNQVFFTLRLSGE